MTNPKHGKSKHNCIFVNIIALCLFFCFTLMRSPNRGATMAQLVERVGLCSEGWRFNPRPASWVMIIVSLGKTGPNLRRVNVYECCMFDVVVRGPVMLNGSHASVRPQGNCGYSRSLPPPV